MTTETNSSESKRGRAQYLRGRVVSDKMTKTRVIELPRTKEHALYKKKMVRKVKLFIHDEKNESHIGDTVLVMSTRPLSKNKSFRLVKIIEKRVTE